MRYAWYAIRSIAITRYTIDNRDTIADRDMVADAGAAADSDPPVVVLHSGFRRRAHACVQLYHSMFFSNYGGNEKDQVPGRPP